jgi:hypothetical protein
MFLSLIVTFDALLIRKGVSKKIPKCFRLRMMPLFKTYRKEFLIVSKMLFTSTEKFLL